ncbi:Gamma-tubulin complex component 6 [Turdus rufiventris]|nr:Gamma-tubulin complex component 6 [Turdus rufiventris]
MASGTALIYDEEMTTHKLLWSDPICDIEVPERLSSSYEQLRSYHLVERCVHVPAREGSEEEILLVHSLEHLEVAKSTQTMNEEELKRVSENYDAFFFHPSTYRCARLAVGATLQLVDAVMSGKVRNGMALVRPPGHHSQRNAANGFCLFNNVAIAAEYAKLKYGLQRILIVDWDVHHGQGTQYIFEEDPSVLYFSWHRYEHQEFWPSLKESDYDAVGLGKGKGFNINLPWNKVGMENSDYLAVFFHVLLPMAFEFDPELVIVSSGYDSGIGDPEGQMNATPEVFAHLTHFLMQLANGKLCVILEGGYHLKSLGESVCMTVKTLLGDPVPQVTGEMAPCLSAVESIQNVRAAHKPYWKWLAYEDTSFVQNLSTKPHLLKMANSNPSTEHESKITNNNNDTVKVDRFLELHMKNILFPVPPIKTAATGCEGSEHFLPEHVQLVKEMDKTEIKALVSDFYADLVKEDKTLLSLGSMFVILDKILKKEDAEGNDFFSAVLGFILPVAYSYQPNLTVIAVGPNRNLGISGISLIVALLQGLAESRIFAVIEDTEINLMQNVAKVLAGASTPSFGIYIPPTQEKVNRIKALRDQFQQEWKMLQCSGLPSHEIRDPDCNCQNLTASFEMESITQLFSDLCEAHLTGLPWKVHLGRQKISKRRAKQNLKRVAYNALFMNLFQDEARKLQSNVSKLPVKNKILMLSFNLRVAGLGAQADRLENLVEELETADCLPFTEVNSVLDLLVQLAGTGPPQLVPQKKDYFLNNKYVGRNVKYQGYDYYDVSVFEADIQSLITNEECQFNDTIQQTLQIMEAAPGTGLPAIGLFSQSCPAGDKFEKETRVSLFGALVHSRTYDMDIKLDLPPVPDNADLSGLAIKVPQSIDQSEDEGFQSASNLTPDSQSEPSITPDIDLWDAVLTYGPSKRRCWERIGYPPGKKEEPYLTEAGREAFDKFYKLREGELQLFTNTVLQLPQLVLVKEPELVKDVLNVLIGVVSTTFSLNQAAQSFVIKEGVYVSGTSPETMHNLLSEVAEYGTYYTRLSRFSLQPVLDSSYSKGLVFQGVKLLSYLYKEALNNCSNEHYPVLLSLLKTSCEPYTRFIYDWVYSGVFRDVYGEFMIQVNEDYLCFRDKHYWTHGYVLISKEVEDCVPVFLKHIANDVYICGKTINLLKLCCPRHYICWSDIPVPRISVIFSLEELKEIERDCAVYVGRMERIARYSSISKEEKDLRMEIAKQELIVHARETASKVLKAISDRQITERMALDAKKREQFQKLKEQFAKDQERRLAIKQEEIDDDFSYARELREREKRLKALEEELEKKARQELIDHYSKLSDDAARREQRTLWKMQRHKLETARLKFLLEDQKRIEEMLEKLPDGNYRRKLDIIPYKQCQSLDKSDVEKDPTSQVSFASLHSKETVDRKEPEPEQGYAASADKALPMPEPEDNNADEHFQPKATGSESNLQNSEKACSSLYSAESLPESNVNIEDFLSKSQDEQSVAVRMQGSLLDEAFRNINSDLSETLHVSESQPVLRGPPEEDNAPLHQQTEYDFNTVLRPSAAWQGHVGVGENVFDVDDRRPRWNIHGHASDSNIRVGDYVPQVDTYQPHPSPYGHSSDSRIKSSDYTSEVEPRRPRWNIHGHVSEAHIKIGEYASETETSRPRWNIHGHASEANIKIGEYVSNVAPARPRWSSHGHASDANIKIGENVSDVVSARPRWNIHGHASQSHIKIGELVSDTEPLKSRWSPFGHASQSSIQMGKWAPSTENDPIPHRKTISGSSSDSTVQTLLYSEELPPAERSRKEAKSSQVKEDTLPQSQISDSVTEIPDANIKDDKKENTIEKKQEVIADVVNKDPSPDSSQSLQREELEKALPQYSVPQETLSSEANTPTTKEEDGEEEDTWKKEQAYLKALSDQYCIEKYQDSYDLMSEPPVSHLLHHVIPRSYTFPVDPMVQSATDETAVQLSELLSLPVLMKRSITAPLVSHVSLVNKAIVDYYFVELNVEKHFEALRHFLLMEDGEFAQSLSDLLFEKLGSGQTPGELLNPLVLNSILNKALQYSLHGDTQLASNLSFALKYLPEMFKPNAPDALSCLELRYKVDWPLNIVITESCMNKYNKIFSFLLQLKHMVWTLKDVWFHLKRTALVSRASNSVQFRQLQLYKHEMQHFVKVIQGYIANQILHVTWCEFGNKLSSVGNLEEIHRTHAEYLNKAIFRQVTILIQIHVKGVASPSLMYIRAKLTFTGLLTEKAAPVMNIIHSIFSLILKFRSQLISQSWSFDAGKQMAVHPNFGLMQQSYNTFKYYSHFLFKVVTKLVNRGYQPHLEDFLLRINFNNYYKDN